MLPLQQRRDDSGLYSFGLTPTSVDKEMVMSTPSNTNLWHRRMGYMNARSLNIVNNTADNGLECRGTHSPCDICSMEKTEQRNHPKKSHHNPDAPLTLVTTDLIGPISPPTNGGVSPCQEIHGRVYKIEGFLPDYVEIGSCGDGLGHPDGFLRSTSP